MIRVLFVLFTLTLISFSAYVFVEIRIYDKRYKLKERIDDSGRINDRNYNLEGRIERVK